MNTQFDVQADIPDSRDWIYQPRLKPIPKVLLAPTNLEILDQKNDGACTGFAIAAAINLMQAKAGNDFRASAKMLYEMAKRHDEWRGKDYEGSSLRGAFQGWRHMGVCSNDMWKFRANDKRSFLTVERAKAARECTLGGYYRVRPNITDFQAALNETGVIVASARIHMGWQGLTDDTIPYPCEELGSHAFIIVGYNDKGFFVQNSYGKEWGMKGLAVWTYEDWLENIFDAWVFRFSNTPKQLFGQRSQNSALALSRNSSIGRNEIAGHFINIDDQGNFRDGKYWSEAKDVEQTAKLIASEKKYKHICFIIHSNLINISSSVKDILRLKEQFKQQGIYPFHFIFSDGYAEEFNELASGIRTKNQNTLPNAYSQSDNVFDLNISDRGKKLWRHLKADLQLATEPHGAAYSSLEIFIDILRAKNAKQKLHLVAHSSGVLLLKDLLASFKRRKIQFDSCQLLTPSLSNDEFVKTILPSIKRKSGLSIKKSYLYNLSDALEKSDQILTPSAYNKSFNYLVSHALEPEEEAYILGLEKCVNTDPRIKRVAKSKLEVFVSDGNNEKSQSASHFGFLKDEATIKNIIKVIKSRRS